MRFVELLAQFFFVWVCRPYTSSFFFLNKTNAPKLVVCSITDKMWKKIEVWKKLWVKFLYMYKLSHLKVDAKDNYKTKTKFQNLNFTRGW